MTAPRRRLPAAVAESNHFVTIGPNEFADNANDRSTLINQHDPHGGSREIAERTATGFNI